MFEAGYRYFHLRNSLTYTSILFGLCGVYIAILTQSWYLTAIFLAASVIADVFDGQFANLFTCSETHQKLGAQLDSMADIIVFGVLPVVCILALSSKAESSASYIILFISSLIYLSCAATRLSLFNIMNAKTVFIGLPTTIAGLVLATLFLFKPSIATCMIVLAVLSVLMVSPIKFKKPSRMGYFILVCWPILVVVIAVYSM